MVKSKQVESQDRALQGGYIMLKIERRACEVVTKRKLGYHQSFAIKTPAKWQSQDMKLCSIELQNMWRLVLSGVRPDSKQGWWDKPVEVALALTCLGYSQILINRKWNTERAWRE